MLRVERTLVRVYLQNPDYVEVGILAETLWLPPFCPFILMALSITLIISLFICRLASSRGDRPQ